MRFFYCFLFYICIFQVSCQSNKVMSSKSLDSRVISFLEKKYNTEVLDFRLNINRNAGNLFDKEFSYSGSYTSKELDYRKAKIKLYDDSDGLKFIYDSYLQEKICLDIDRNIESTIINVNFVIYVQMMDMANPSDEIVNQDINEIKEEFLQNRNITTRVLVSAPDLKENREKYLQFHIDVMRELKAHKIEKCVLYFNFFDERLDISNLRFDTQEVIAKPEDEYMVERWSSIHNNKWYDMVKDHPDKVLKYGKVFNYK